MVRRVALVLRPHREPGQLEDLPLGYQCTVTKFAKYALVEFRESCPFVHCPLLSDVGWSFIRAQSIGPRKGSRSPPSSHWSLRDAGHSSLERYVVAVKCLVFWWVRVKSCSSCSPLCALRTTFAFSAARWTQFTSHRPSLPFDSHPCVSSLFPVYIGGFSRCTF